MAFCAFVGLSIARLFYSGCLLRILRCHNYGTPGYATIRPVVSARLYLEQLPYESNSDGNEFDGYLGPDAYDGPVNVIICIINSAGYED